MTLVFLLWIVLRIDGARATDGVDDIGELIAALCAALICGGAAQRVSVGRTSWALLAASSLGVGDRRSAVELLRPHQGRPGAVPFPGRCGLPCRHPSGVRRAPALPELAPTHLSSCPGPARRLHHRHGVALCQLGDDPRPSVPISPGQRAQASHLTGVSDERCRDGLLGRDLDRTGRTPGMDQFGPGHDRRGRLRRRRQLLCLSDGGQQLWKWELSRYRLGRRIPADRSGGTVGDDRTIASRRTDRGLHDVGAGALPSGTGRAGRDIDSAAAWAPRRARRLGHGASCSWSLSSAASSCVCGVRRRISNRHDYFIAADRRCDAVHTTPTPTPCSWVGNVMNGYHPTPGSGSSSVRVSPPIALSFPTRRLTGSSRPVGSASGRRLTAWIVRTIMVATTAFAILDLSLLVSSVHH